MKNMKNITLALALLGATICFSQSTFTVPGNTAQVNIMGLDTFALDWITKDFTLVEMVDGHITVRDLAGAPEHKFRWSSECCAEYGPTLEIGKVYTFDIKEGQVNRIVKY